MILSITIKNMKRKEKYANYLFELIFIMTLFVQIVYTFSQNVSLLLIQKGILIIIQMISILGIGYSQYIGQKKSKKEILEKIIHLLFFVYCFHLISVLFLDSDFGRVVSQKESFYEYAKNNVNVTLFASIRLFYNGYINGVVTLGAILKNLFGNLFIFMPMAYFLPHYFKKQKKWYVFLITMVILVFCVEVLQVVLMSGSGDIDDLFLNVLGSMIMFALLKIWRKEKE